MVKKVILLVLFISCLSADALDDKIHSFLSEYKYKESKNLINYIFSPRENYYKNDDVDSIAILETLNNNGLLELFLNEPRDVELVFHVNFNPIVSIKNIADSLNSMGYSFFLTKKISKSLEGLYWHISISTQYVPNPALLNSSLNSRGCEIESVSKNGNTWSYQINSRRASIDSITLKKGIEEQFKKPLTPYWFNTKDGINNMIVKSSYADFWHPRISFYTESLELINIIDLSDRKYSIRVNIPKKTAYIKIEDRYTLDNIKRGLKITAN